MNERKRLRERLRELDAAIRRARQWGAALTALNEERKGVLAALSYYEDA